MSVVKSFQIYEKRHASGNTGFRVDMGLVNGKRTFRNFATRAAAEKFQHKCLKLEATKSPTIIADVKDFTRHEVLAALARLKEYNVSITEAVEFYLKHARPAKADADIQKIMDEFQDVKSKAGLSAKYLSTARRSFFTPFKDDFKNCLITDVTAEACEKYIYKHKTWNGTTRATHIRHLVVLFRFAIDKGYAALNPFEKVQRPKKQASKSGDKVATVEDVIKILQYAKKNDYKPECAALVLVLFCGVRTEEVDKLTWDKIKLDESTPVVVLDETKANRRRVNPIPPNALEWLKLLRGKGKITPDNYEGRMRYLRKVAKVDFKQNTARISFASYHVAMHEDGAKTSLLLGHQNGALLWNTYRALVTKDEAERYWKIDPDYTGVDIRTNPSAEQASKAQAKKLGDVLARAAK